MTFVKGKSGNPGGRTPLPKELQGIVSLSKDEITARVSKLARMRDGDHDALLASPDTMAIDKSIIKNIRDYRQLGFLLDRTVGKVVEQIQLYGGLGNPEDYEALPQAAVDALAAGQLPKMINVTPTTTEEKSNGNAIPGSPSSAGDGKS